VDIEFSTDRIPLTQLTAAWVHQHKVALTVLRADLIDAEISGNKYFKLLPNLQVARAQGHTTLLSFGGPWSNHLHALAAAGRRYGFRTIGLVRGEQSGLLTPCLQDAANWGMELHFVTRQDYRRKTEAAWLQTLVERFGPHYLIPEGGANLAGLQGCQHLLPVGGDYSHLLLACGTGTTLAGLVTVSAVPVLGIQVLKGAGYLQQQISQMLQQHGQEATCEWQVLDDWHGGGYARMSAELLAFMRRFETDTGVPLEPVYSGKLMQALVGLIRQDYFPPGARLLVIHGGGLQGRRSLG
jgi:1-aminocyclopropane-1-carboxylate deaminase